MDFSFINQCRKSQADNERIIKDRSLESIIDFLFKMKLKGKDKARQLGEYDGESLLGNTTLVPGNIYAFLYKAETPATYDDGKIKFKFYDSLPIVLITHVKGNICRGINLNLCNRALRAYIINTLHNLDLDFFADGGRQMAEKGRAPISQSVTKVFLDQNKEKQFYEEIRIQCKIQNYSIFVRSYNTRNMTQVRLIENWQHQYIPFLTYTGELKQDVLELIWKVTGTDRLTL